MSRALVAGGSLGGLTAALVLRDQGWDVDVLERSAVPLQDRGAGIVLHPTTVRYLVERVGKAIDDIGLPASRLHYLEDDGSIVDEQPCAYRFASYGELYRGLLDAFGTEHYHLSNELAHLDDRDDAATLTLTDGRTSAADLVVCADGIHSTGRRFCCPTPTRATRDTLLGGAPSARRTQRSNGERSAGREHLPNPPARPPADLSDSR